MKVLKIIGVFMFGCIGIGILSGYDGSQHTSSNLVFGIIFVLLGFCFLYSIMRSTKRATTEKQIPDNAVGFSPSANESEIADDSNQDSLILLSEQKKMFLVNYLGDRSITWHIDEPVKERYPDIEQNIEDLQKAGLIKKEKGVYVLTESGQEMRKTFRAQERARREEMHQSAVDFALSGDYLSAYNARAKYEKESVIPHGISVNLGGGSNTPTWEVASEIPYNIKNYIGNSCKLDFSDCENSERFKEALRGKVALSRT